MLALTRLQVCDFTCCEVLMASSPTTMFQPDTCCFNFPNAAAVGGHRHLETLILSANNASDRGVQALIAALAHNSSIKDITLNEASCSISVAANGLKNDSNDSYRAFKTIRSMGCSSRASLPIRFCRNIAARLHTH